MSDETIGKPARDEWDRLEAEDRRNKIREVCELLYSSVGRIDESAIEDDAKSLSETINQQTKIIDDCLAKLVWLE